jgi:siroheme decarboxylase
MVNRMDEIDLKLLAIIGKGLALTKEPFNQIALQIGINQKEVMTRLNRLKQEGIIRKFGASIKPSSVGFSANALIAWKTPQNRTQEVGEYLSKLPEISHCYERKIADGRWEFNLYTVMHAKERESILSKVSQIATEAEIAEYKILFSTRDLKKTSSLESNSVIHSEESVRPLKEMEYL